MNYINFNNNINSNLYFKLKNQKINNEETNEETNESNKMTNDGLSLLHQNFTGIIYRLSNFWFDIIPFFSGPIKYLEIGVLYGANALSVAESYCHHENSEIHCVDPWLEYKEDGVKAYDDINIEDVYLNFQKNISLSKHKDKFKIYKDFSHNIIPTFKDNTFDIIYIDGNHGYINVLEDAMMSFRKLKIGGYLIFDDVDWRNTMTSINAFTDLYKPFIEILACQNFQLFIKKIKNTDNDNS